MGSSLALSCNIRFFVIGLDYGYQYLLEVYSELSSICFLSWLYYYSMISWYNCSVLEIVSLLFLELYQLFQYSHDCSSVMSVHPEGGGSTRDTRVSLTSIDMMSRLAKTSWMSTIPTVCRGSRQVVTTLSVPFSNHPHSVWGGRRYIKSPGSTGSSRRFDSDLPVV